MARPIDQGMIALEKILGEEAHPDIEKAPWSTRRQRKWQENRAKDYYYGFCVKEWGRQGEQV